jgi:anti-anti-sigma regulatory factor
MTTTQVSREVDVVQPEGRLFFNNAAFETLKDEVNKGINAGHDISIDMSKVLILDSAVMGFLLKEAFKKARDAGLGVNVFGALRRVEQQFIKIGAHNFIQLYPDEEQAKAAFIHS